MLNETEKRQSEVIMVVGKALVVGGLAANILSAVCIGQILPRESTVSYGSAVHRPFTQLGRLADQIGWPLLAVGFAAELVGTVL